jgi:hypothetical protein
MSVVIRHFKPFNDNGNVKCLNGSAHVWETRNIKEVTCPKCLDDNVAKSFWHEHEKKKGNQNKN